MTVFAVFPEVFCHQFEDECLAYSALTGETILVSDFAAHILRTLIAKKQDFDGLLSSIKPQHYEGMDIELSLHNTLNELGRRGFIDSLK